MKHLNYTIKKYVVTFFGKQSRSIELLTLRVKEIWNVWQKNELMNINYSLGPSGTIKDLSSFH